MTPQIAKVMPAGTNRFGYESDNSPVVRLLIGRVVASALTTTVPIKKIKLKILKIFLDV